jgi:glycosyltransferase involved in cell wall biosynthesis
MKFCVVLGHFPKDTPGGAEFQSYLIARELARRGHDAHYIAYRGQPRGVVKDEGITIHRLDVKYSSPDVPSEIVDEVGSVNSDYVYFRNFPDLYILNELQDEIQAETIFNVSHDRQCLRLRNDWRQMLSLSNVYKWITDPSTYRTRWLLDVPDYRFVQTRYQQSLLEENFGLESDYVGNGHPVPEGLESKLDPPVVLWLASLKAWKQPLKFLSIAETCHDLECQFWLVGRPSNEDITAEVVDGAGRLPNVDYKGGCTFQESNELIKRAAIFVNTSVQEGFPNTFIQSWLRETPVVSLNVNPDGVLSNNEIGMCAEGDLDVLIEAIRSLVLDSKRRNKIGARAGEYGQSNHNISLVVDRLLNAII